MESRITTKETPDRPARCQGRGHTFFWSALLIIGIVTLCSVL